MSERVKMVLGVLAVLAFFAVFFTMAYYGMTPAS